MGISIQMQICSLILVSMILILFFSKNKLDMFINKVLISELDKTKYQKRIFLTIEDNKTQILETGTEVNFIEIIDYINEQKNEKNQYEELYKYLDKESDDVLLVGIKMNRMEK